MPMLAQVLCVDERNLRPPSAAPGLEFNPRKPTTNFRADINALRALAVALVILFHFKIRGFEGGFLGVDIFFVISGFLMTKIVLTGLEQGQFKYFNFVMMRVARIWPALVALVLILMFLGALLLPPLDYEDLAHQAYTALLFYSNLHYRDGLGYFVSGADERWLLHTWSLSVEWQFYLLYPLFLLALFALIRWCKHRLPMIDIRQAVLVALVGLFLVSLAISITKTNANPGRAFFMLHSRAWEMVAGGIIFVLEPRLALMPERWRRGLRLAAVMGIMLVTFFAGREGWEHHWPGALALGPVVATMVILATGSGSAIRMPRWATFAAVQKLGLWSYSIYLWHWPVVVLINFLEIDNSVKRYAKLAGMVASILLGYASYRWIESRFKYRSDVRWLQPATLLPATGAMVAGVAAMLVATTDGWDSRVAKDADFYKKFADTKKARIYPAMCDNFKKDGHDLTRCIVNPDATGPRVLVYGDSHAEHLYSWFEQNARNRVDFLTMGGCPPVRGFNRRAEGYHCDEFVQTALDLADRPEYETIIVAGNWTGGMDAVPSSLCAVKTGGCSIDQPASRLELIESNRAEWEKLLRKGKRVVLVERNAFAAFNLPTTSMRRHFWGWPQRNTFSDIHATSAPAPDYIADVLARLAGESRLSRVNLRQSICTGADCSALDTATGAPVFTDNNHYSPDWMRRHGDVFAPYVKLARSR